MRVDLPSGLLAASAWVMIHSVVLLFSGQGAQKVGMGGDLAAVSPAAAELFAMAEQALDFDLTTVMMNGPAEVLTRTSECQPAG